jgi:uncharacterized protein DUF3105
MRLRLLLVPVLIVVGVFTQYALRDSPRGLIRSLPANQWLDSLSEMDRPVFLFHVAVGASFDRFGASPLSVASEWFKAAWHSQSYGEIVQAASGLRDAERRATPEQLEANLCPFVSGWSDETGWGARGRQLAALQLAHLSCGDASTIYGTVPDDTPITYPMDPPVSGLYHQTWYPSYGLAPSPVAPATWVHNLAHGEIVLLYNCPEGCPDALARAVQLQSDLPAGRNPRGPGARMIITSYPALHSRFALLAWGVSVPLDTFDADQVAGFYADHVDQGIECRNLHC